MERRKRQVSPSPKKKGNGPRVLEHGREGKKKKERSQQKEGGGKI